MTVSYADELAFQTADPRRRTSDEVDLGATWRAAGSAEAWRLAWLRDTGELYLAQVSGLAGSDPYVRVLARVPDENALDALLEGWRERRDDEDGLGWLRERLQLLPA